MARRAAEFGVTIDGAVTVEMPRVKARKDAIVAKSRDGLQSWLKGMENCTVIDGHALFESEREIRVGADRFTAAKIFINVGGRALVQTRGRER